MVINNANRGMAKLFRRENSLSKIDKPLQCRLHSEMKTFCLSGRKFPMNPKFFAATG
jgi:hypothetical protein